MNDKKHIKKLPIIDHSGFEPKPGAIITAKKHNYFIIKDIAITGDAPKDFIRYYSFGKGLKNNSNTWPLYIAKHGHKHYPVEAITEHLLNRIGEEFGFTMAESGLGWFGGQIRFLSKYFLNKPCEQTLQHGADLYSGYLNNDKDFVEEVERNNQSPDFFTVQFTETTLKYFFPDDYERLFNEFLKLLILDALIGNNDRHFYNWGIITNISGKEKPIFSPIYDTARGLFWNEHEDKLKRILQDKNRLPQFIMSYAKNSVPKIGWEGFRKLNHFDLVENISKVPNLSNDKIIRNIFENNLVENVIKMIDFEFEEILSNDRRTLIKLCLQYRYDELQKMFNFAK